MIEIKALAHSAVKPHLSLIATVNLEVQRANIEIALDLHAHARDFMLDLSNPAKRRLSAAFVYMSQEANIPGNSRMSLFTLAERSATRLSLLFFAAGLTSKVVNALSFLQARVKLLEDEKLRTKELVTATLESLVEENSSLKDQLESLEEAMRTMKQTLDSQSEIISQQQEFIKQLQNQNSSPISSPVASPTPFSGSPSLSSSSPSGYPPKFLAPSSVSLLSLSLANSAQAPRRNANRWSSGLIDPPRRAQAAPVLGSMARDASGFLGSSRTFASHSSLHALRFAFFA